MTGGGLRILIANNTFAYRGGTETYIRDLAIALLRRGHRPVAYSTTLGPVAEELRAATVPVVDDLNLLGDEPDLIHGHKHLETMTALLRFPATPAIYFCHGWTPWVDAAPQFPTIRRYVAASLALRDRLVFENGIPENRVTILPNFVDLERFQVREPLPEVPRRGLVFNNTIGEENGLRAVREACARAQIRLDAVGVVAGNPCAHPEKILGQYDIVFGVGRCALEAMAVGAAVILCDSPGSGPLVTTAELDRLRMLNFGLRALTEPIDPEALLCQMRRYDPADAMEVSRRIRQTAGLDEAAEKIVSLSHQAIAEHARLGPPDAQSEFRAAAAYLQRWGPRFKGLVEYVEHRLVSRIALAEGAPAVAQPADRVLGAEVERLRTELRAVHSSLTWRLTQGFLRLPVIRNLQGPLARLAARRFSG